MRLQWTEIDLNNETSSLTRTAIKWMTGTDCVFTPAVALTAKLKDIYFFQWGLKKGHKETNQLKDYR